MGLPTGFEAHGIPQRFQKRLLKAVSGRAGLRIVVALTTFIRQRLADLGVPAQRICVQPDSVDMQAFEGLPSRHECRRRLGLAEQGPIIGYIGRFQALGMDNKTNYGDHWQGPLPIILTSAKWWQRFRKSEKFLFASVDFEKASVADFVRKSQCLVKIISHLFRPIGV